MRSYRVIKRFPALYLPKAWSWFSNSPALFNKHTSNVEEFCSWAAPLESWGILRGAELVGIVLFEPVVWPGSTAPTDGYITFALARSEWGKGVLGITRGEILSDLFEYFPTVRRVSGYTLATNKAARHAAERLGCTEEGLLADATAQGDIVIFGLTRKDFYGQRT